MDIHFIAFSKTSVFVAGVFVRISVNTFTKTEVFLSVFLQKRSTVNGAYVFCSALCARQSKFPMSHFDDIEYEAKCVVVLPG